MHAFPYKNDALQFWSLGKKAMQNKNFFGIIGFPLAVIIYVINVLRFIWIDAFYALFIISTCWHAFSTIGDPSIDMCWNGDIDSCLIILNDKDNPDRDEATLALGRLRDEKAIEALILALKDDDVTIRENAAQGLGDIGDIGDRRAVEPLILALKDDDDATVRGDAARALGMIWDRRAVEPLILALKDDDDATVRGDAAWALGYIRDRRAVEPLILALKDDDAIISREHAAGALGRIGDRRAIEPLIQISMMENDGYVKNAADDALEKFGIEIKPYKLKSENHSIFNEPVIYANSSYAIEIPNSA